MALSHRGATALSLSRSLLFSFPLPSHRTLMLSRSLSSISLASRRTLTSFLYKSAMSTSASGPGGSTAPTRHTNRLASEHSPYLLQHAHNPVDWYPWGEEAFEAARKRDVPIFLSIGYSTCHWCHVMEVESFENEEVAKLLNDWFVSIKVDREERPDVDKVYMTFIQALYGSGGWPLSVFLSPNLKPMMGGTYFPPDDKYNRAGFKTVLRKVKQAWDTKRETLEMGGTQAIDQLTEALSTSAKSTKVSDDLAHRCLNQCVEQLTSSYDPKFGGFGSAPKFPRPVEDCVMLYKHKQLMESGKDSEAGDLMKMVTHTLQCMARGGIHDHVGGGFHRYSVDECWHVPHFEKMLYDQGQIVNVYLDTFLITGDNYYSSIARDILDYLRRDMIGKEGEIYSAEDADSYEHEGAPRKKEGAFYYWSSEEVIVSWNGLVISALARASQILNLEPKGIGFHFPVVGSDPSEYLEAAEKAVSFIKRKLYDEITNRLQHSFRNGPSKAPGFLDDYAFLISGLLDLYEYGGNIDWLQWAIQLQTTQDELFLDREGGGYFNTPGEDPSVLLRVKEDHDGAEPSGNSVSAINLIRLASFVGTDKSDTYRQTAEHLLAVFETRLSEQSVAVPLMCCAADMLSVPSRKQIVLVGDKEAPQYKEMLATAFASYDPNRTVIQIDPKNAEAMDFWEKTNQNIAQMACGGPPDVPAAAHVCQNFKCSPIVTSSDGLENILNKK
ncbi:catalytics isoform X2 [Carex rostrata]